jgi:hypothetical protein
MKTVLFSPETINIAETTRMVEIAKLVKDRHNCVFTGYAMNIHLLSKILDLNSYP